MTGSRVKSLLGAVALSALLVPAGAQWTDGKPPVLGPNDYPPEATEEVPEQQQPGSSLKPQPVETASEPGEASAAPRALGEGSGSGAAPVPLAPGGIVKAPAAVEVDNLGKAEGPPVGTLDSSNGGFGDHLWSGSTRSKVEDLLKRAPLVSGDPVLRDLVRRVVLTKAPPPPGQSKKAFVTTRIERLLDAGLIAEAGAIAAEAQVANDEDFNRVQARAILTANRAGDACGPATAARLTAGETFWLQLRAYCAAASGDDATAELTRAVLKAQGKADPAYDTLVAGVLSKKPLPAGAIAQPTAVHIFLLQQNGLAVTEAIARKMGTPEALLVVRDPRSSPQAKFEAADRIVATGVLSGAELVKIADAQDLPLARVSAAASEAPNLPFYVGQVLLRRAATIEPRPEEKARLAALALSLGEKFKLAPYAAALQADVIASLKPSPAMRDDARAFAKALILAGRSDLVGRWAYGDPVMKVVAAFAAHDPARVAAVQNDLNTFAVSLAKNPPDPDTDRSYKALILGLADVTGFTMPPAAKASAAGFESQMWEGERPGPGTMRTLHEVAANPDRRGEAILMLTGTVHTIGLKNLAPDVTVEFVRLLTEMNEPAVARSLALEALAQYNPPPPPPPPPPVDGAQPAMLPAPAQ